MFLTISSKHIVANILGSGAICNDAIILSVLGECVQIIHNGEHNYTIQN